MVFASTWKRDCHGSCFCNGSYDSTILSSKNPASNSLSSGLLTFPFDIKLAVLCIPNYSSRVRQSECGPDICWWEKWTMVTILTEHDSCQSQPWLRWHFRESLLNSANFKQLWGFHIHPMFDWHLTQKFNRGLVNQPRYLKRTLMCGERVSLFKISATVQTRIEFQASFRRVFRLRCSHTA